VSSICYLDASALAKLLVAEPESDDLFDQLEQSGAMLATSLVGAVEVERVCRRMDVPASEVRRVLDEVVMLSFDVAVAAIAGRIAPPVLRALDAIHLATARALGSDLDVMYCYDRRLAAAAELVGIDVRSPGLAS
jgi:predicted nucleic acid-binding protein